MPAAVYVGDGAIEVRDLPVPQPAPGDVLVEVSHCGICGTDLHLVLERIARPGSVLGHEWAGTVVAAGADAGPWSAGDRVVADATPGCGECRACRRGRPAVCLQREPPDFLSFRGAFSRYVTVPADRLLRLPESLPTRAAALTEPTAVAMHAVTLSGATPDDRVLITGAGPVGLLTLAVLRARGVEDVTVSEPAPRRRARAQDVGAVRAVEPADLPSPAIGHTVPEPFTIAFECSGNPLAGEAALAQLDYAGTLVFVGTGHESPRIDQNRMIIIELTAIGAYNYDAAGFAPALELLASGALPLDLLVEPDDVGLAGLLPAMHRLAAGELPGKVMVRPWP
jgi:2-desacetyl-2-hydroxyethyl bacteriochlorophyllide A dehydrogenase